MANEIQVIVNIPSHVLCRVLTYVGREESLEKIIINSLTSFAIRREEETMKLNRVKDK